MAAEAERILAEASAKAIKVDVGATVSANCVESAVARAASVALGNVKVISNEESERRAQIEQQFVDSERARALAEGAHLPERYRLANLRDADRLPGDARRPWLAKARELRGILESDSIFVLCGERGPGKTHMACALINECITRGKSARYAKLTDYVNEVKSSFGGTRNIQALEREWKAPFLLVLDEEQERFGTVTEHIYVTRLIDLRYDALRPTLIISNQSAQALESSLGASIVSRATDGGGVIECDWPSVRGRLRKGNL